MKRAMRILSLAGLAVCALILCAACGAKSEEPSVFERGTWALSSFDGMQAPYHYGKWNYHFDYNERGQIVESRKFSDAVNIINGQSMTCTWSGDGLSYECSYTLVSGNFGEISRSGTSKATFQAEYDELSATYTAHGDRLPYPWKRDGGTLSYTLDYRADGTLKHKEVKGYESEDSLEVYDYDEHGKQRRRRIRHPRESARALLHLRTRAAYRRQGKCRICRLRWKRNGHHVLDLHREARPPVASAHSGRGGKRVRTTVDRHGPPSSSSIA